MDRGQAQSRSGCPSGGLLAARLAWLQAASEAPDPASEEGAQQLPSHGVRQATTGDAQAIANLQAVGESVARALAEVQRLMGQSEPIRAAASIQTAILIRQADPSSQLLSISWLHQLANPDRTAEGKAPLLEALTNADDPLELVQQLIVLARHTWTSNASPYSLLQMGVWPEQAGWIVNDQESLLAAWGKRLDWHLTVARNIAKDILRGWKVKAGETLSAAFNRAAAQDQFASSVSLDPWTIISKRLAGLTALHLWTNMLHNGTTQQLVLQRLLEQGHGSTVAFAADYHLSL